LELKHQKAKREQKILAALLGLAVFGITSIGVMSGNLTTGWVIIAIVYDAVVIAVIFSELIDETWVEARIRESEIAQRVELSRYEPVAIDIIS